MEPMTGIEPAYSAWEADVLPLNYIGVVLTKDSNPARPLHPIPVRGGGARPEPTPDDNGLDKLLTHSRKRVIVAG